jgi:hypothetical protein
MSSYVILEEDEVRRRIQAIFMLLRLDPSLRSRMTEEETAKAMKKTSAVSITPLHLPATEKTALIIETPEARS